MAHVLFLSAWCPLPTDNGSKLRIAALLRELAREHTVDLISFAPELPDSESLYQLRAMCHSVELVPEMPFAANPAGRLRGLLSTKPRSVVANFNTTMAKAVQARQGRRYDLVIASQVHMAPYALLLHNVPRLLEEVELAILYEQPQHYTSALKRLRYRLTWWKTRRYIAGLLRHFAAATTVSAKEMELLQPLSSPRTQLAVVPNGVDTAACAGDFGAPEANTLIYPGSLSYIANFDAVNHFLDAIWPHVRSMQPNARLRVTGRATPEQVAALPPAEGVEFTGFLNDVRSAVAQSWAEVVPLRQGGGTRLKVLEALALGTPIVSTTKGIEGLDVEDGRHLLVANNAKTFAERTAQLLAQPELRQRLAAAGRALVRERYDWSIIGSRLNALVQQTARQG
jgi:glycosyltransferase involved in cell wall biosynthesis